MPASPTSATATVTAPVETNNADGQATPPPHFVCPLTKQVMKDPMMSKHGHHFERVAILDWLDQGHTYCPISHKPLRPSNLVSDKSLRRKIRMWARKTNYVGKDMDDDWANGDTGHSRLSTASSTHRTTNDWNSVDGDDDDDSLGFANEEDDVVDQRIFSAHITLTPDRFICPLTKKIMKDPVMTKTGLNFDRKAILKALQSNGCICPVTKKPLPPSGVIANSKLAWEIKQWELQYGSTPPPPPTKSRSRRVKSLSPKMSSRKELNNNAKPSTRKGKVDMLKSASYHTSSYAKFARSAQAKSTSPGESLKESTWSHLTVDDILEKSGSDDPASMEAATLSILDQLEDQPELCDVLDEVMNAVSISK